MQPFSAPVVAALQARVLVPRDFYFFTGFNLLTEEMESVGLWNDVGNISAEVIDGLTRATVERDFFGSGTVIQRSEIANTSDISVREVTVTLSQIDAVTESLVRGYRLKGAPTEIYLGMLDPTTRNLVAPAEPVFVGFVEKAPLTTPAEGQDGGIALTLVSHTRELLRGNTDVRSHESQLKRSGGTDRFYEYTGVVSDWDLRWGKKSGKLAPAAGSRVPKGTTGQPAWSDRR